MSTRLRIAQVAPVWSAVPPAQYGGTELMIHLLTEELVRRDCDVTLFASGDSRTSARLHPLTAVPVTRLMVLSEAEEYDHYANANLVEALRTSASFDVIHSHLGFQQIPVGTLSKTPVIHTLHTTPSVDDRWTLERYPDVPVVAVSRAQVEAVSPPRRESIRVIHHALDFEAYTFEPGPGTYLAFVGRMNPQKSPLDAIRIAELAGMSLVLAGAPENATEEEYFNAEIVPRLDGSRVRHVGRVDHARKNEVLRNAAALLFPIQGNEAFGLVMIEAMACGTPVLAWNRASVPEIIDPGETGFYASTIEELASHVSGAVALDRTGVRERARRRFELSRMVDEYLLAYAAARLSAAQPLRS